MVVGKDGKSRSAGKALRRDPPTYRLRHAPQLGVGAVLDVIVTLKLEGDIVRPALGALDKTVVKSGHEKTGMGRGEYTRKAVHAARVCLDGAVSARVNHRERNKARITNLFVNCCSR